MKRRRKTQTAHRSDYYRGPNYSNNNRQLLFSDMKMRKRKKPNKFPGDFVALQSQLNHSTKPTTHLCPKSLSLSSTIYLNNHHHHYHHYHYYYYYLITLLIFVASQVLYSASSLIVVPIEGQSSASLSSISQLKSAAASISDKSSDQLDRNLQILHHHHNQQQQSIHHHHQQHSSYHLAQAAGGKYTRSLNKQQQHQRFHFKRNYSNQVDNSTDGPIDDHLEDEDNNNSNSNQDIDEPMATSTSNRTRTVFQVQEEALNQNQNLNQNENQNSLASKSFTAGANSQLTGSNGGQDGAAQTQLLSTSQQLAQVSPTSNSGGSGNQLTTEQSPLVRSQQIAANDFALAQEANKVASKLNAEMCRNFSIGLQHELGGIFTSPNYPNPYPENLICTRLIEGNCSQRELVGYLSDCSGLCLGPATGREPRTGQIVHQRYWPAPPGHYIVLEFRDQFNIEEAGTDCDNDKLEIRDGRYGYSKVLARYCGSKFPPEVKSSNEAMWLRFISDSSIAHTGFKAVYRFERQQNAKPNPPFECRFNVTSTSPLISVTPQTGSPQSSVNGSGGAETVRSGIHSGVIRNSDIPNELLTYVEKQNVSLECIWNITVMPGWKIYLTFSNYEISKPNDCDSNFIEIYEENLTEENQTVKFCGTRTEPQQSKSNVFNIRHHAISSAAHSRFEIIYTAFREKGAAGCDAKAEFDCDDGTCIHGSLKCDGQVNCKYRYDEAVEPGPCQNGDTENSFFETEHMVIILIVFLTLVSGMCASIIISCWGKIQERRRRKLEYHMRKSREASMEGQLNKIDQLGSSFQGDGGPANSSANGMNKRSLALNSTANNNLNNNNNNSNNMSIESLQHQHQQQLLQTGAKFPIDTQQQFQANGQLQRFLAAANDEIEVANDAIIQSGHHHFGLPIPANYNIYGPPNQQQQMLQQQALSLQAMMQSNSSLDQNGDSGKRAIYGSRPKIHDFPPEIGALNQKSLQTSVQHSILATMAAQKQAQQQQQHNSINKQSVPDSSSNNFNNSISNLESNQQLQETLAQQDAQQQQQQLLKQHQQKLYQIGSMPSTIRNSIQQQDSQSNEHYNRYIRQQQASLNSSNIPPGAILNQPASSTQTMPINLAKQYNNFLIQQQQHLAGQQLPYHQQRALTLSTMHQPSYGDRNRNLQTIYGMNPGENLQHQHLSSSITCCNALGDFGPMMNAGETPLLSNLMSRASAANQQHQLQHQMSQTQGANRMYELRSATMNARLQGQAGIPRSLSAHQLSKIHQQQQQQSAAARQAQAQQAARQLQVHQHPHPVPYKSASDAGHQNRHQPPNHSLSYPHACTSVQHHQHGDGGPEMGRTNQSPALPPPPPPPNLTGTGRAASGGDSKRAAFKVSRLEPSQMTGDTLQDSDMGLVSGVGPNMGASMQFDDPSTESDATFGMLVNSIGNTPLNLRRPLPMANNFNLAKQQQLVGPQYLSLRNAQLAGSVPPTHLSECKFIRCQRSDLVADRSDQLTNQALICDCGALERASQLQQQQQQLHQHQHPQQQQLIPGSSHEFDDSEECLMAGSNPQQPHQQQQQQLMMVAANQQLGPTGNPYARFRQQSSEFTNEDEDDDDDVILDDDDDDDEDDDDEANGQDDGRLRHPQLARPNELDYGLDDELSSETGGQQLKYRRPIIRNEELRDAPQQKRNALSGSRTSVSGQSCTCGSQLQLDRLGFNGDESPPETARISAKKQPLPSNAKEVGAGDGQFGGEQTNGNNANNANNKSMNVEDCDQMPVVVGGTNTEDYAAESTGNNQTKYGG